MDKLKVRKFLEAMVLLLIGGLSSFYGGFCLLGGPDGAVLSLASFIWSIPSLLVALVVMVLAKKGFSTGVVIFLPLIMVIFAFGAAVFVSQATGFYLWMFGVPFSLWVVFLWSLARVVKD